MVRTLFQQLKIFHSTKFKYNIKCNLKKTNFCRDVKPGDIVTIGECRPLSKTVKFNVLKVSNSSGSKKQFSKF